MNNMEKVETEKNHLSVSETSSNQVPTSIILGVKKGEEKKWKDPFLVAANPRSRASALFGERWAREAASDDIMQCHIGFL